MEGFIKGDFISETDSLAVVAGQITSSFIPLVDIRDVMGNLHNDDYVFASINLMGLAPIAGDLTSAVAKAGKFIVKNVDEVPKVIELIEFLSENCPEVLKVLEKSDEFAEEAKQLSKAENFNITRKHQKLLLEQFEKAGLSEYLIKTSNNLELEGSIKIPDVDEVWEEGAVTRGKMIDEFLNGHTEGKGLGRNFPVADRLDNRVLVSTKSIDLAAKSYQEPKKLKYTLNRYANA